MGLTALAPGADRILSLRKSGMRPGEMVVISMVGKLPVEWPVLPESGEEYDWVWAVHLDVLIVVSTSTEKSEFTTLLAGLRQINNRPRRIYVWVHETRTGCELWFHPTLETVAGPPDKWQWIVEPVAFIACQNESIASSLYQGEA